MTYLESARRVLLGGMLSIALVVSVLAAPGRAQISPPGECAKPVPLDEVAVG